MIATSFIDSNVVALRKLERVVAELLGARLLSYPS